MQPNREWTSLNDVLSSWKDIAVYLGREIRTVQLWEKHEGLPVRRHMHSVHSSVFAWKWEVDGWLARRRSERKLQRTKTLVAVLPIANQTGNPENHRFVTGLTDELVTYLGRFACSQLSVVASTASMRYKDSTLSLQKIAQELGADHILEGTFHADRDRLRMTLRLIQPHNQTVVWAESYDRVSADPFMIRKEVASSAASAIAQYLVSARECSAARFRPVRDYQASESYAKGRYYWRRRTIESLRRAIGYFENAILRDPTYAAAFSGLADTYTLLAFYGLIPTPRAALRAKTAAVRALEIDPDLGEAHASYALVSTYFDWNWATAELEYRRALDLSPTYPEAHFWYASFLELMARYDEALNYAERAVELDSASFMARLVLGSIHYSSGDYDLAVQHFEAILRTEPDRALAHWAIGLAYQQEGKYEEAIVHTQQAASLCQPSTLMSAGLIHSYAMAGRETKAQSLIPQLRVRAQGSPVFPYEMATIYSALGDRDKAFAYLYKAYENRTVQLTYVKTEPRLKTLRSDARFDDLLRRMSINA